MKRTDRFFATSDDVDPVCGAMRGPVLRGVSRHFHERSRRKQAFDAVPASVRTVDQKTFLPRPVTAMDRPHRGGDAGIRLEPARGTVVQPRRCSGAFGDGDLGIRDAVDASEGLEGDLPHRFLALVGHMA
jgi:hypothetical protein